MRFVKYFIAVLVCFAFVPHNWAQTHYDAQISVGGKAGATLSKVNFNPSVPQSMIPGIMFGATFRYLEERHFGIIAELNVEQRGWKEKFDKSDYQYRHSFTYLELPIMTHIFFGNQRVKGFFNLGPEINVMLGDGIKSNFSYQDAGADEYFINDTRHIEQMAMKINGDLDIDPEFHKGTRFMLDFHS